ncbi:MAG: 30S ribosomal protein S8 [Methylococcaceae bacterium]
MSMTDPVADLLTRIRNGQEARKTEISLPSSKFKQAICLLLKDEGYINDCCVIDTEGKPTLKIVLKYYKGTPVIDSIQRVSKPGRRVYRTKDDLPVVLGGLGVAIVSTSKGLMTDQQARESGQGGEVICTVS